MTLGRTQANHAFIQEGQDGSGSLKAMFLDFKILQTIFEKSRQMYISVKLF